MRKSYHQLSYSPGSTPPRRSIDNMRKIDRIAYHGRVSVSLWIVFESLNLWIGKREYCFGHISPRTRWSRSRQINIKVVFILFISNEPYFVQALWSEMIDTGEERWRTRGKKTMSGIRGNHNYNYSLHCSFLSKFNKNKNKIKN